MGTVALIMLNSACCEEFLDFSSLLLIGVSGGVLLLIWIVLRYRQEVYSNISFYQILKQSYCCCLYKQNPSLPPPYSNYRSRVDSVNYPAPRTSRSWSDVTGMTAMLSRV